MGKTSKSETVPKSMQDKFNEITEETDAFCEKYLNDEYKQTIRYAVAALCRKRPSPLLRGRVNTWASGIVHAIGTANFLFDRSQTPHCQVSDIYTYFGIASSTSTNKSKEVRDLLKIRPLSADWMLPSKIEKNSLVWIIQVNGLFVDARDMPVVIQRIAYEKGLIPYVPDEANDP